jgi:hypothetical protein
MPVQPHKKHYLYRKRLSQKEFETASTLSNKIIQRGAAPP